MSSRNARLDTSYNEQVGAYHKAYTSTRDIRESVLGEHLQNISAIVTGAVLLLTLFVSLFSPDGTFLGVLSAVASFLWDAAVYVIPTRLLFALDDWLDPSRSSRPMREAQRNSHHAAKSETLRRVMGLDRPGGMMSSIFRARTRALSVTTSVLGLKLDYDRPPGLGNRDNSCYQNSILQSLASLSSMPDYLATCVQGTELSGKDSGKNVALTLRTLISELNDVSNNGRTLWTPSLLKSMSTWTQQDAQEYYSVILDDIDKGAALAVKAMNAGKISGLEGLHAAEKYPHPHPHPHPHAKDEISESEHSEHSSDSGYQSSASSGARRPEEAKTVRNPLEGLLAQRVSCVQCGHTDGLSMVPFNCLTLSLGLDKHQHDLYERLDSYSKVETIEGVDCPKCTLLRAQRLLGKLVQKLREDGLPEKKLAEPLRRLAAVNAALEEDRFDDATLKNSCKIPTRVSTTKTKQMVIARPPQSLVVHVNRSVFDPSTMNMIKNSAPVNFPMVLDLGPWCLGSAEQEEEEGEDEDEESGESEESEESAASTTTATLNGHAAIPNGKGEEDDDSEEQWELDPMVSMVAGDMRPSRLAGPIYELRAAVTHYGRHENGHYICYRKYPPYGSPAEETAEDSMSKTATPDEGIDGGEDHEAINGDGDGDGDVVDNDNDNEEEEEEDADAVDGATGEATRDAGSRGEAGKTKTKTNNRHTEWWRLSDHNVSKVDEELVMSLSPGVFMLFYECVDPCMVLQPAVDERPDAHVEANGVEEEEEEEESSTTETVGGEEDTRSTTEDAIAGQDAVGGDEAEAQAQAQPDGSVSASGVDRSGEEREAVELE